MKININTRCKVILTASGARILNDLAWGSFWKEGDEYQGNLWELMQAFGSKMSMGSVNLPFFKDNVIEIYEKINDNSIEIYE